MTNDTNRQEPAQVKDRTKRPPGLLDPGMRKVLVLALALLVVMVLAASNRGRGASPAAAPEARRPAVSRNGLSPREIEDYERRMREALEEDRKKIKELQQVLEPAVKPPGLQSPEFGGGSPAEGILDGPRRVTRPGGVVTKTDILIVRRPDKPTTPVTTTPSRPSEAAESVEAGRVTGKGEAPSGPATYTIPEGTLIEAALTNRLDGEFVGPANCMLTNDVRDAFGETLLIPKGSRVLGKVQPVSGFGQQRLGITFHRLLLPNTTSIGLEQFSGLNSIGETGLRDKVNRHYMQMFGSAGAIGLLSALSRGGARYGYGVSGWEAYCAELSSSLGDEALGLFERFTNVKPTFTIREGTRVIIYVSSDLRLPAYPRRAAFDSREAGTGKEEMQ
jgi:type IV secretion system protein VirB10